MKRNPLLSCLVILALLVMTLPSLAKPLFDPQRHMRVDEVKPGMTGYGLSVFSGTKIERFEVEVISILRNFNPRHDVILIRCRGANLEHTGAISGMSGSPIYLKDDAGNHRMVGAFAYGWPLQKDPIAGVQPIEYMLAIPEPTTQPANPPADGNVTTTDPNAINAQPRARWNLEDSVLLPGSSNPPAKYPFARWGELHANPRLGAGDLADHTRLRPLATPLMAGGLSPELMQQLGPVLQAYGLVPLQAGGGGSREAEEADVKIEPGSVLAVPLMTGDIELTAVGTTTEVLDGRVWGFGHAFQNEGFVKLPMGSGRIHTVIANLATSFKLGTMSQLRGTLTGDELVGIAGRMGETPNMAPIDIRVTYADGSADRPYHFNTVLHPRYTPILTGMAIAAAVGSARDLPQYHTLDYDITLDFENGQTLRLQNRVVDSTPAELFFEVGNPLIAAGDNPFKRVPVKSVKGTVRVLPESRQAIITSVNVPRLKYRPGETVNAFVTYRPFRAGEAILPVEFELPRDLPEGTYQLVVSDWMRYLNDEREARPFRFTAESIDEVFGVLTDITAVRRNALYLRLLKQPDGVAIGRTAMPSLPSSRRHVLLSAGRSNTTPFVSSTVKTLPTEYVMEGEAVFEITVDKDARVELGSAKPAKPEPQPAPNNGAKSAKPADAAEPKPSSAQ